MQNNVDINKIGLIGLAISIPAGLGTLWAYAASDAGSPMRSYGIFVLIALGIVLLTSLIWQIYTSMTIYQSKQIVAMLTDEVLLSNQSEYIASALASMIGDTPNVPLGSIDSPRVSKYVYQVMAERYGIGYSSVQVECAINPNGSALVQRTVSVSAFSKIDELETYLSTPESSEEDENGEIGLIGVESLNETYTVVKKDEASQPGKTIVTIMINPDLTNGDELDYQIKEQLPEDLFAINLTNAELEKRELPYDYFGWNINRPTKKLSVRVHFPVMREKRPKFINSEVRYASASGIPSRYHEEEKKRVTGPNVEFDAIGRCILKLDIDYPMIGLIYIICWEPLTIPD